MVEPRRTASDDGTDARVTSVAKPEPIRRISLAEALMLMRVLALLPATLIRLRRMPLPDLVRHYDRTGATTWPSVEPARCAQLINGLLRTILRRDFCMPASLLLFLILRSARETATIIFGVTHRDQSLRGHAWVELDGRALGEADDPRATFRITYSYPDA